MPIIVEISKTSKYGVLYNTPNNIRYILMYGPRGTGKSFQNSRADVINLITKPYYRGFLMRNVLDTVRDSNFQDCLDRIDELNLPISVSDLLLKYRANQLKGRGFRKSSGQDTAKNKSVAGINSISIEEAEEVDPMDFHAMDLSLRTTKGQVAIKLVFNPPVKGHWILNEWFNLIPATKEDAVKHFGWCWFDKVEDKYLDGYFLAIPRSDRKDTHYIFSTYHENIKNLDPNTVAKMERFLETDVDYYLHKVCGLVPSGKTGRIIRKYQIITAEEWEQLPYPSYFGLDFGYTNDPTAVAEIKRHNNKLYVRERLYQTGLTNPKIYDQINWIKKKIIADSAEPKSIAELRNMGLFIMPAKKGADSIRIGIERLNQHEIYICEDSKNAQNEAQNWIYKLDKNKEPTNEPEDDFNHFWDAVRYALEDLYLPKISVG